MRRWIWKAAYRFGRTLPDINGVISSRLIEPKSSSPDGGGGGNSVVVGVWRAQDTTAAAEEGSREGDIGGVSITM